MVKQRERLFCCIQVDMEVEVGWGKSINGYPMTYFLSTIPIFLENVCVTF